MTPSARAQSWLNTGTVFIDTETTGLSKTDQVIEIAVIDGLGAVLMDCRIRPTVPINPHAQAVHGISARCLEGMPTWDRIHSRFQAAIEGKTVVAFNATFDASIINQTAAAHRLCIRFERTECAMKLAASHLNTGSRISLANAAKAVGVRFDGNAHSALVDIMTTLKIVRAIAGHRT